MGVPVAIVRLGKSAGFDDEYWVLEARKVSSNEGSEYTLAMVLYIYEFVRTVSSRASASELC